MLNIEVSEHFSDWLYQVTFEGKKGSLFDFLEDYDADVCLQRAQQIS